MPGLFTTQTVSILPATQQSPGAIKSLAAQIQGATRGTDVEQFGNMAGRAVQNIQDQVNTIMNALRSPLPFPDSIGITDASGNLIAWIGQPPANNPTLPPVWVESLGIAGSVTLPIWRFNADGNAHALNTAGSLDLEPGLEVQVADAVANVGTLAPTGLQITTTSGGGATSQINANTSYLFAVNMAGSLGSPIIQVLNSGAIDISYPSNVFFTIDDTGFFKVLDAAGDFAQATPTGFLTQNAAGTRFTSVSDAGAVSGQSVGATTFLLNGNSLKVSNLPTANPGAGTKLFWCDTTASNVVKYAV